jgi:hypothetical protein
MKSKLVTLLLIAAALPAAATITINTQFGTAFDAAGAPVADGTLWALIADTNGDNLFAGGFGINASLAQSGAAVFGGQTLALGSVFGGDTVFKLGAFNGAGPGVTDGPFGFTLGENSLAAGQRYAFYWFPGVIASASHVVGSQVGGINNSLPADGGLDPMVVPADGAGVFQGAANADGGGTLANSRFTAVLIPEPSTALLGALGALGLLRRRR